ncbi:MAG: hypothetical protein INR72_16665, partial [Williamsia herbipolensis]|nr:hypothetical protein [Williamsia herbipolensis]
MGTIRFRALVSGAVAALLAVGAVTVVAAPAEARPATGGSGRFGSAIDWIEWGTNRQTLPDTGFTGTT